MPKSNVDVQRSDYNVVLRRHRSREFDAHSRLQREYIYTNSASTPAFVRETYRDDLGRTVAVTDPRFATASDSHAANQDDANRTFAYDALDRLVSVTEGATTSSPRVTSFTYDAHDNLATMTDPDGRLTKYLYDDFGSLIAVSSPDSGITLYRYDARARQVEAKYADGRQTSIAYDGLNRVTSRVDTKSSNTVTIAYHYDNLTGSGSNPGSSCMINSNAFDPSQSLLSGRLAWVSVGGMVRYFGYDAYGYVTAVYEQTGSTFDVCNLSITRYAYDAEGRPTSTTYPAGMRSRLDYSNRERADTENMQFPGYSEGTGASFTRDVDGEIASAYFSPWGPVSLAVSRDFSGAWTRRLYTRSSTTLFDWAIDYNNDGTVAATERDGNGNVLKVLDRVSNDGFVATMNEFDELTAYQRPGASSPECQYAYDSGARA